MNTDNLLITIDRLTSAIKYISWALQEEEDKQRLEWLKESDWMIEHAKEWLNKEIPF